MNYEILFTLPDKANQNNALFERFQLRWFNQNGVPISKTTTKSSQIDIVGKYIVLDSKNHIYLYCKAPLQEFFLSYTILIGDNTPLYKAKFIEEGEVYIEEKNIEDIKNKLVHATIKKVDVEQIYGYSIEWDFTKPSILNDIDEYVYEKKNLQLLTTHVHKGDKVELFTPTLKKSHFEIAKTMQIPLLSLIDKGFLQNTHINIFDTLTLKKELSPCIHETINQTYKVAHNGDNIYRDIERQLKIQLPKEDMRNFLLSLENRNVSKKELIKNIETFEELQIGSAYANSYQLPVWKSNKQFLTFSSIIEFEQYVGVRYDKKINALQTLYLINTEGEGLDYPGYYLYSKLYSLVYYQNPPLLDFKTYEELFALWYLYQDAFPYSIIIKSFPVDHKKSYELWRISSKLLYGLLNQALATNTLPKANRPQHPLEHIISHHIDEVIQLRNSYLEESKEKLLESTISSAKYIMTYYNQFSQLFNPSYYYLEFARQIIITLSFFNQKAEQLEQIDKEYFKEVESRYHLPLEEKVYHTYMLALRALHLSQENEIVVYKKTQNQLPNILSNCREISSTEISYYVKKIKKHKIQQLYPKSYQSILNNYNSTSKLPEKLNQSEKIIEDIPIIDYYSIKGMCEDFIIYSK